MWPVLLRFRSSEINNGLRASERHRIKDMTINSSKDNDNHVYDYNGYKSK